MYLAIIGVVAIFALVNFFTAIALRRVVPTNEVHIVQSSRHTTSYGKDTKNGNVYYEWPNWMPVIGVSKTVLPVSVFKIELKSYEAYDTGRVPFEVDVVAFFRIEDSNMAAQRVASFMQLQEQLMYMVQGAVRSVLASHDIDKIMIERSTFGEAFTKEVQEQLLNWGVIPVKNLELMDIRDGKGDQVIHNIMQKKKSLIEMQSRTEVADNMKNAKIAEINAERDAQIQNQQALQAVGEREAEKNKQIGVAQEKSTQEIKEQQRITKEKEMAVTKVAQVQQANITKEVNVVEAEQTKQTTVLIAEGKLESKKREAEGIQIEGTAKAEAEKALQLAPVTAQITLAKEIGSNEGYQNYLVTLRRVEATQVVGVEQAKALEKANVKIIANTGEPTNGLTNVMDLFTPKGGTSIAGMLEALAQTDEGQKILAKIGPKAA